MNNSKKFCPNCTQQINLNKFFIVKSNIINHTNTSTLIIDIKNEGEYAGCMVLEKLYDLLWNNTDFLRFLSNESTILCTVFVPDTTIEGQFLETYLFHSTGYINNNTSFQEFLNLVESTIEIGHINTEISEYNLIIRIII